jgi:hypothetical protein
MILPTSCLSFSHACVVQRLEEDSDRDEVIG